MAIRCDAAGDDLRRTASLPANTAYTACGWTRVIVDVPGTTRSIVALEGAASAFHTLQWAAATNNLVVSSNGSADAVFASNPELNQWFFWAMRCSGTGAGLLKAYFRRLHGRGFVTVTSTSAAFTPISLTWMNSSFSEPVNGRVAGIKVWDAVLTDYEIMRESFQLAPARRYRLHLWAQENTVADLSGRGRVLTKTGTLTYEPGPPIPLFANQPIILDHVNAAASQGVLSAAGDATATFVGQSTAASVLSGAGDATGVFVGKSLAAATLSAPGDATATFTGKALAAAVLSAPGDASAAFVGRSSAASVLAAPADATGAFVGKSDSAAVLSASGDSSASFVGRSNAAAVWAAAADATGSFVGTSQVAGDSVLSAAGDSTGIFVGQSFAAAVLEAVAAANADWRGDFTVPVDTTVDGSGMRFTRRGKPARKRTSADIAREQKMVRDYLDELDKKALAQVPGAATPGSRAAEAGSLQVEPATSVKGTDVAAPAPVLASVARVNALQRMAELEEEALEAERNEQQQQRRRAAASAVLLMSY